MQISVDLFEMRGHLDGIKGPSVKSQTLLKAVAVN